MALDELQHEQFEVVVVPRSVRWLGELPHWRRYKLVLFDSEGTEKKMAETMPHGDVGILVFQLS